MKQVVILMGSDSDLEQLKPAISTLKDFGVTYDVRVLSAHRTPKTLVKYLAGLKKMGTKVIIAAAGGAAHLAGVCAAHTTLPVIGVPIETQNLGGLDSLLSTVQMPGGMPVATVAIGKPGALNSALLACQILALSNKKIETKLKNYRAQFESKIDAKNKKLQSKLKEVSL